MCENVHFVLQGKGAKNDLKQEIDTITFELRVSQRERHQLEGSWVAKAEP